MRKYRIFAMSTGPPALRSSRRTATRLRVFVSTSPSFSMSLSRSAVSAVFLSVLSRSFSHAAKEGYPVRNQASVGPVIVVMAM